MTDKKRNELLRKRNDELSRRLEAVTDQLKYEISELKEEKEGLKKYVSSVDEIKREFEDLILEISRKQEEYDRYISQAKAMRKIVFNSGHRVKLPFFTRLRLFFIKHKR